MLAFVKYGKNHVPYWFGTHHFTFKYGTILYFKARVATLGLV